MSTGLLIVDDELPLLKNLANYLGSFNFEFDVHTAGSAEEALEILEGDADVDIMLTDIRMPGMNGIELVQRAAEIRSGLSILVMTAFPSASVRKKATAAGAISYMEKPIDMKELRQVLLQTVEQRAGWSGSVVGLDLFDFTQLFMLSGKSKAIRVDRGRNQGVLIFSNGSLVHASTGDTAGDEAFYSMATWEGGKFQEIPDEDVTSFASNIDSSTNHLMMEAARMRDEAARGDDDSDLDEIFGTVSGPDQQVEVKSPTTTKEEREMAVKDHLAEFEDVQGFKGVAVFTAQGEMLEGIAKGKTDIKTVGMFANNALLNAQKATDQMGVGRGNMMQIRAPEAVVLMRCLNEATDFAATKEGKAHFHTVVVLDPEGNTGMATMLLDRAVGKIAEELR